MSSSSYIRVGLDQRKLDRKRKEGKGKGKGKELKREPNDKREISKSEAGK
jgi:hypothetical protein